MFQFSSLLPEKGLVVELTAGGSKLLSRVLMSTGSLAAVFRHDLLIYKYSADVRNVVKSNLELWVGWGGGIFIYSRTQQHSVFHERLNGLSSLCTIHY